MAELVRRRGKVGHKKDSAASEFEGGQRANTI